MTKHNSIKVNDLLDSSKEPREYKLILLQEPKVARMSSFNEKRPVDPPAIIELEIYDRFGNIDDDALRSPFWVLHVVLDDSNRSLPKPQSQILQGSLTSSAHYCKKDANRYGCFFYFSDLTLTTEGVYRLKFLLTTVCLLPNMTHKDPLPVLVEAITNPFTVFTAKKFPGMAPSSELAKSLALQGVKIPIRNEERKRSHKIEDQQN
ncbi:hypothetical protein E3Q22_02657 [Wallemia mellicola]|uniref:Velvet domain-containing protein n=2 Tax=Wallemia mellicola TaxID=1708541 RepID=A0A4T0PQQ7_9BASI|nr:hypothetical protein WALSEDRAFT_61792 [Wallemia mellicola CBS 633.66]TIB70352.1 hypothetical protein E3Q24_02998 [Wallemia mellicola]EIM23965.1 hypothetical protein WALSEDRAFT_61792 [Wallemia mellicola CBS 633.66]TIB70862.1 hypothetical protein E3Q23_04008 [Wallemia mellicola]TIB78302.1 hypothetical protein E3Q22_02657 [Wallemia mellicola]TIB88357.1 hypothetical protein E3Q21_00942 [Wallemia mellicola]|eukprot:XP_006955802.1 hypothetical protein WALSEDRAFT_61792 [Wallemia mellicola CBS 633.66]